MGVSETICDKVIQNTEHLASQESADFRENFPVTPNGVLTAHTEWLPGVQLWHSVPPVQYI